MMFDEVTLNLPIVRQLKRIKQTAGWGTINKINGIR